ncbi:MAG: hypothetical protein O2820_22860 [Planctomycetota bacterium]|nr:hypothetical protein [Planctomycetota bacterium]MDA1252059.1 hypothetical protein [Planctomycetota bacterium]
MRNLIDLRWVKQRRVMPGRVLASIVHAVAEYKGRETASERPLKLSSGVDGKGVAAWSQKRIEIEVPLLVRGP